MGARGPQERGLIDPDRAHRDQPVRVAHQWCSPLGDLRHHGVPGHPELRRDGGHRPVVVADLLERPLPGPFGQHRPGRDSVLLLCPGLAGAQHVSALEDPFTPPHNHRYTGAGQVPHRHHPTILDPGDRPALRAPRQLTRCRNPDMPFTADHLGRQHLETGHAEQGSNVVIHLGLLALVVTWR